MDTTTTTKQTAQQKMTLFFKEQMEALAAVGLNSDTQQHSIAPSAHTHDQWSDDESQSGQPQFRSLSTQGIKGHLDQPYSLRFWVINIADLHA
ncbi:MAG: hypothetical protein VXY77_00660, partial [Pseudomonadota bacterium]|nr:hypothetical protein [Pseudomonadota bacterium]